MITALIDVNRAAGSPTYIFFQAEDGIRAKLVTGVQTCALPIYPRRPGLLRFRGPGDQWLAGGGGRGRCGRADLPARRRHRGRLGTLQPDEQAADRSRQQRSEERRVGKEGGRRGGPGAGKKKGRK